MKKFIALLVLVLVVLACVLYFRHTPIKPAVPQKKLMVSQGAQPGPGKFYHDGNVLLPNPAISPGMLRLDATETQVCSTSTREFRHRRVRNLFIQPYNPPDGVAGAHAKDALENWLHHRVCVDHVMTLKQAQEAISRDWYQTYLDMNLAPE